MPREAEPSLNEKQFFAKALQENIRLDGRAFDHYRALELEFGPELGVSDVRLGKTRYIFLLFQSCLRSLLTSTYHQLVLSNLGVYKRTKREQPTDPSLQNPNPHHSRSNNPLPRPPLRRPLHHHHRTLPYALPHNRAHPPHRSPNPPHAPLGENNPSLPIPRNRIIMPNRRSKMLVYSRRCSRFKPRREFSRYGVYRCYCCFAAF